MAADPILQNVLGVQSLVGSRLNKLSMGASNQEEGVLGEHIDDLSLDLDDAELLRLSKKWTANYIGYESAIKLRQDKNYTYYLGKQKEGGGYTTTDGEPISANLLFEAEETFLPVALQKNPDPIVYSDNTEEGVKISTDVKTMLQYHADVLVLRRKLNRVVRHWSVYFIGIMKHGWDSSIEEIASDVRNPKNFILDPDGFVDEYADYIGPLGERIDVTASELIEMFPEQSDYITVMVDGSLGTKVMYTEWWTDEYCFYTFKDVVLDKSKNPNFNYAEGARNHFAKPKKPYTFLSIFSFGEQPHDVTTLIEQNIPNQRRVTRRTEQIDYNLSRQNNSTAFSMDNFNQEEAKQAASAMAKGHPVLVPPGKPIAEAMVKIGMEGLPPAVFNALENDKNDLRSVFGTEGLSAQPVDKGELATNLVMNEKHDASRVGGGIGDALEQFCDNVFNWWAQLYCVFYDQPHVASILGSDKAVEYITLQAKDLDRRLVISVSPDSMKPKDELTEMNQAMELFKAGALDPKTLLTRMNVPDVQKVTEQTVLWMLDKAAYMQLNFPEIAQQLSQAQAANAAGANQGQAQAAQQEAQGAAQQQQMQQQAQAQSQQMALAQKEQEMRMKDEEHQQKMKHNEDLHEQKKKHDKESTKKDNKK